MDPLHQMNKRLVEREREKKQQLTYTGILNAKELTAKWKRKECPDAMWKRSRLRDAMLRDAIIVLFCSFATEFVQFSTISWNLGTKKERNTYLFVLIFKFFHYFLNR